MYIVCEKILEYFDMLSLVQ